MAGLERVYECMYIYLHEKEFCATDDVVADVSRWLLRGAQPAHRGTTHDTDTIRQVFRNNIETV